MLPNDVQCCPMEIEMLPNDVQCCPMEIEMLPNDVQFVLLYWGVGRANSSCCPLRPRTTPFPEEESILGVVYGVLLWADMNAATPLGARGRSGMSLGRTRSQSSGGRPTATADPMALFNKYVDA